ncbi:MFS transporter [Haloechinothrix sp. YIM 98757]|uniref:MFS transporter n=1 Tax=Haloechinothrix aidingensis TaxID=2752311 RepID=A0A838ABL3_9PSEU|nr:MFS transporter [Haloechinothrix aidingensis]MBA0126627.1 MFS transporter [Haloechinothrix aidingensis]
MSGTVPLHPGAGVSPTRWPAVLVLMGAGVVAALHIGKAPGALPVIRDELELSLPLAGFVISSFNLTGALLGLALGALSDVVGHRRSAVGGLLAIGLTSAIGALADSAVPLLLSRFAEGVAFMVVVLSVPGLLARVSRQHDLGLVMGSWPAYMPTGTALMLLAAAPLVAVMGWRGTWLVAAVLSVVWAVLVAWVSRGAAPGEVAGRAGSGWAAGAKPTRGSLLLGLAFAAYAAQILAVLGFLPTMLVEEQGLAVAAAAALTAGAFAANAPGNVLGGVLQHRGLARWRMIVGSSVVMAVAAVLVYAEALPLGVRYAACVAMSLVGGFIPSAVLGAVPDVARSPRSVGAATGVAMQGANLGQLIGPPAVAALAGIAGGWHLTPVATGVLAAAAAACGLALRRMR